LDAVLRGHSGRSKGDWRAFNRAPIAAQAAETLDRLPSPAATSIQAIKAASGRGTHIGKRAIRRRSTTTS